MFLFAENVGPKVTIMNFGWIKGSVTNQSTDRPIMEDHLVNLNAIIKKKYKNVANVHDFGSYGFTGFNVKTRNINDSRSSAFKML